MIHHCPDCGCGQGELHELYCLKERCPFCSTQLVCCNCIVAQLELTPEEVEILDTYEDDQVDPARSILVRWERALEKKGRVPFDPT